MDQLERKEFSAPVTMTKRGRERERERTSDGRTCRRGCAVTSIFAWPGQIKAFTFPRSLSLSRVRPGLRAPPSTCLTVVPEMQKQIFKKVYTFFFFFFLNTHNWRSPAQKKRARLAPAESKTLGSANDADLVLTSILTTARTGGASHTGRSSNPSRLANLAQLANQCRPARRGSSTLAPLNGTERKPKEEYEWDGR